MLHWLEVDDSGIVREAETEGNKTVQQEPFSGKAIETFEQSPTKSISSWKDGNRHGITIEYFYNGRKRTSIVYKEGKRHGPSQEFRITGELWREETYQEDQLTGPKSEWYPNGVKSFQVEMKEGIAHGEAKEWYADGIEKSSSIYRHGLREGPSSEWYPSGQQKLALFYQKDQQHGLRTIWYENGTKRLSAQFVDDMMEGNSKGWFPSGQQQFDYNFKNNLEHGVCVEWNEKGEKISEIRFNNGVPAQDLLTGQRIVAPVLPAIIEEPQGKEATPAENSEETDELRKVDLPPLPETENAAESVVPVVKVSEPIKVKKKNKDKPKAKDTQEVKPEPVPTAVTPNIPVVTDEVPQPPKTEIKEVINESIESNLPPLPPSPQPAPSFDPFGALPSPNNPEIKPAISPDLSSTNSSKNNPLELTDNIEASEDSFTDPSIPSSFDPFGENPVPPVIPPANPFEESPPPTKNLLNAPSPAPDFDPFADSIDVPQNQNEPEELPLGEVFGNPPPLDLNQSGDKGTPQTPSPTFDPFEN